MEKVWSLLTCGLADLLLTRRCDEKVDVVDLAEVSATLTVWLWNEWTAADVLRGAFRIPSRILIRSTFGGKSSIPTSTKTRHSGHLSSLCVWTISSKHFLQNVCWQGRTLLDVSNLSKHTEHSNRSFKVHSSILRWEFLSPRLGKAAFHHLQ